MSKTKSRKQRFSFNDRTAYHEKRTKSFVDKFRFKTAHGVSVDWDAMEKAERKNPRAAYSEGYYSGAEDAKRGSRDENLSKFSSLYQLGYNKAQSHYKKALDRKF